MAYTVPVIINLTWDLWWYGELHVEAPQQTRSYPYGWTQSSLQQTVAPEKAFHTGRTEAFWSAMASPNNASFFASCRRPRATTASIASRSSASCRISSCRSRWRILLGSAILEAKPVNDEKIQCSLFILFWLPVRSSDLTHDCRA